MCGMAPSEVNPVDPIIDEHGIEVVLRRRKLGAGTMTSIPRIGTSATESSWPNVRWDHSADIEARPLRIINEIYGDGPEAEYIRSFDHERPLGVDRRASLSVHGLFPYLLDL